MGSSPVFVTSGRIAVVGLTAANTATDGSGTIFPLITGASGGTRVLEIAVKAAATSASAVVNIFLSSDGGTTWKLFDSITVSAVTQSATVAGYRFAVVYDNLVLPSTSHVVGVTTTVAQATNVIALGGDV